MAASFDALPANIMVADSSLTVVFVNRAAMATLRRLESELRRAFGLGAEDILHGSAHRFHADPERVELMLEALDFDQVHEARFAFGDVVLEAEISRLGQSRFIVFWKDVSALAVAHRKSENLNQELSHKNKLLGRETALLRRAAAVSQFGTVVMNFRTGEVVGAAGLGDVMGVEDDDSARAFLAFIARNPVLDEAVADCLTRGEPFDLDIQYDLEGSVVWLHVSGREIENPETGERCLFGVVQNIEDRKRAEHELRDRSRGLARALDEARVAARAKAEFLANMSHELRTPLNAILGSAHLIETIDRSPEERELFEALCAGAQRLEELAEEILVVSEVNSGALTLERSVFEASDVVDQVLLAHQQRAEHMGVKLDFELESPHRIQLVGDPRRFRQIVGAFVSNSIKFSRRGYVRVRVEERVDGFLRVTVIDDGIGIEEAAQQKIFDEFAQASEGSTRRFEGTGLGLTLAHRLVQAMGGTLELKSALGKGTTVTVTFSFDLASSELARAEWRHPFRWHGPRGGLGGELRNLYGLGARPAPPESTEGLDIWMRSEGDEFESSAPGLHVWPLGSRYPGSSGAAIHIQQPVSRTVLLESAAQALQAADVLSASEAAPASLKVLVVDDVATNRLIVCRMLKRLGAQAEVADGGEAAVRTCLEQPFDLVLMDLQMPDVDGFEAARRILKHRPDAYIVALTANVLTEHRSASLSAGMQGFLTKPVSRAQLDALLRTLSSKPEGALSSPPIDAAECTGTDPLCQIRHTRST